MSLLQRSAVVGFTLLLLAACSKDGGDDSATATTAAPTTTTDPRDAVTYEDKLLAYDFIAWARSSVYSGPPEFADSVRLILGPEASAEVVLDEPSDPSTWVFPEEADFFRGAVGPLRPLDSLAGPQNVTVKMGPHQTCAIPAAPVPADLASLRHIAIEATDIDSCNYWYSVDIFVNDEKLIEAVIYDLYEP